MIVVAKKKLIIYSILTMKLFYEKDGFYWDAVFIPKTALIAVVEHDGTIKSKRTLKIIDLEKDSIVAHVEIKFNI